MCLYRGWKSSAIGSYACQTQEEISFPESLGFLVSGNTGVYWYTGVLIAMDHLDVILIQCGLMIHLMAHFPGKRWVPIIVCMYRKYRVGHRVGNK